MRWAAVLLLLAACSAKPQPSTGAGGSGGQGGNGPPPEDCSNGLDDDGNGLVDCADPACREDPHCPVCGDGYLDPREACEGADFRGVTCAALGYDGGLLTCSDTCQVDASRCTRRERCDVPGDEDGNGAADCADRACAGYPGCYQLSLKSGPGAADASSSFRAVLQVTNAAGYPIPGVVISLTGPSTSMVGPPASTDPSGSASFDIYLGRLPGDDAAFTAGIPGTAVTLSFTVRIRQPAAGIVSTVVNATRSSGQDESGPAIGAALGAIIDLQVSSTGELYLAEPCRILAVSPAGELSRLAGDGTCSGMEPDGISVSGLALDEKGSALYFADALAGKVRALDLRSGTLRTIAGDAAGALKPIAVSFFGGVLFVTDAIGNRVVRVDPATGLLTTEVAATNDPLDACLHDTILQDCSSRPCRVAVDPGGNRYVAGTLCIDRPGVLRLDAGGPVRVAGMSPGYPTPLGPWLHLPDVPVAAFDEADNLFLLSGGSLFRIDGVSTGTSTLAGSNGPGFAGDGGPLSAARFNQPSAMAFGPGGDLYIADTGNAAVRRVTGLGTSTPTKVTGTVVKGDGQTAPLASSFPNAFSFRLADSSGNPIFSDATLVALDPGAGIPDDSLSAGKTGVVGRLVWSGIVPNTEVFEGYARGVDGRPHGTPATFHVQAVAPDPGTLVSVLARAGTATPTYGSTVPAPLANVIVRGIANGANGSLYIADNCQIDRLQPDGGLLAVAGAGCGAGVDGDGPLESRAIQPQALAFDQGTGILYFIDHSNLLRAVDFKAGTITTLVGDGASNAAPGLKAEGTTFGQGTVSGLAADGKGKLYIAVLSGVEGLFRLDLASGTFDDFLAPAPCPGGAAMTWATSVATDGASVYASVNCSGPLEVLRLNGDGTLEEFAPFGTTALAIDPSGALVAARADVVYRYDPVTRGAEQIADIPYGADLLIFTGEGRLGVVSSSDLLIQW